MYAGTSTATNHTFYTYNASNQIKQSLTIQNSQISILDTAILIANTIRTSAPASTSNLLYDNMTTGTLTISGTGATTNIQGAVVNILAPTLNLNYTGVVSISAPNATGLTMFSGYNTSASLFQNFNTGTITLGDAGFPGGTINLSSSVRLRNQIILHKKRMISANTTLTFPIEETCQITATGNITIT